ncbi:hypothetical protein ACVR1G_06510 [Streptococcus dentasini]
MTADEKILALVRPEYMKRIPKIFQNHATKATLTKIAREHPDLYSKADIEGELPADVAQELSDIINGIFEERMKKHNF